MKRGLRAACSALPLLAAPLIDLFLLYFLFYLGGPAARFAVSCLTFPATRVRARPGLPAQRRSMLLFHRAPLPRSTPFPYLCILIAAFAFYAVGLCGTTARPHRLQVVSFPFYAIALYSDCSGGASISVSLGAAFVVVVEPVARRTGCSVGSARARPVLQGACSPTPPPPLPCDHLRDVGIHPFKRFARVE